MPSGSLVTQEILQTLRDHLGMPKLELILREEWSSEAPDYRRTIRENLLSDLQKFVFVSDSQREVMLDLMQIPQHPLAGISISHNRKCGGYALNPESGNLGMDVEVVARVKSGVVARASETEELTNAPSPAALWTAKEAALKSFNGVTGAPEIIADVHIGNWQNGACAGVELCQVVGVEDGPKGCVVELGEMKVAVFHRGGKNALVTH